MTAMRRFCIEIAALLLAIGLNTNSGKAQSDSLSMSNRGSDTLVVFKNHFDRNALPVYTNRDSETERDSSIYASIQQKPRFYKNFESGSIGTIRYCASDTCLLSYKISSAPDPENPIDILAPSSRWFYFLMSGVKGKKIAIQLTGTDPRAAVYSYDNKSWQRYDVKSEATDNYRITKLYERDSVYIAYYVPYTNSHLSEKIENWRYRSGVRVYSLGKSHQGREMDMLVVTNDFVPDKNKKRIYIHSRVHPSETPCSWALEGLIDYLTGNTTEAFDMRSKAIFYILPFSNPDGVALGYSRCDAIGVNMEINYNQPDSLTRPEVNNIKKFISTTTYGNNHLDLILNFHSQIAPHFTYWIHTEKSTSKRYFKDELTFAALTIAQNRYASNNNLSYSAVAPRYIEGYIWESAKEKTLALTHETPYSYYNKDEEGEWVTIDNLKEIGIKTLFSIFEYLGVSTSQRIVALPEKNKKCHLRDDRDHLYIGENYLEAKRDNIEVRYKIPHLRRGDYEIYKWIVGSTDYEGSEEENCWQLIGEHRQNTGAKFEYELKVKKGEKINALLFVKK